MTTFLTTFFSPIYYKEKLHLFFMEEINTSDIYEEIIRKLSELNKILEGILENEKELQALSEN
jgi:hypothetical protein